MWYYCCDCVVLKYFLTIDKHNATFYSTRTRSNKKQVELLVDFMYSQKADAQWLRIKDLLKGYGPDRSIEQWKQVIKTNFLTSAKLNCIS